MAGILEGLKVIEMGHFVAAPAAGAMFGDWGAEVIKIEPIDGEAFRGFQSVIKDLLGGDVNWRFEVVNRSKKSMGLDLSKANGREILYRLVEKSDIFLTNYELDVVNKLQVDYESLSKVNPAIIYAALTGYGSIGPDKNERGFDFAAAWARSGIQHMISEPDSVPPMQRGGMMDRTAGAHMVAGTLAALWHREKTGEGQALEFSLYHTGVWTIAADYQVALGGQPLTSNDRSQALNPLWNSYCAKDGRWFQLAMLQADLSWADFCRAIERPELENDPRFADIVARGGNCQELIRILEDVFMTRDRAEWEKRFQANNCIYGRIETPEEVINDPQARVNGFFTEVEHPEAGRVKYVATPVKFQQNPAEIKGPSPEAGQHTEEILLELGYDWDRIVEFKKKKAIIN